MMQLNWRSGARLVALLLFMGSALAADFDVKAHYEKHEHQIAMRDGVKLFTTVYTPRDQSQHYPILFKRTPYSIAPYGADRYHPPMDLAPGDAFLRDGYILVLQDVRGRYKSEGQWDNYRLLRRDEKSIDEATDIHDTIEWLLRNVNGHNGRVGQWGISHDGWMTVMGMIRPHPALKAVSPQATTADAFFGDDFHHNGAFIQQILDWVHYMGVSNQARGERAEMKTPEIDYGTPWPYEFFLRAGPLDGINAKYFGGVLEKQWDEAIQHPDYDDYWRQRNALEPLVNIELPVLNVSGWFDTFDPYGSMATYRAIEKKNPRNRNTVVAGPWRHGGWRFDDGSKLGAVEFGSATSVYFQDQVIFPFFQRHLKDKGDWAQPEAVMFETGGNAWHRFDQWPPKAVVPENIYLQAGGKLSLTKPADATACDEYVSDPSKPVPHTTGISKELSDTWRIEDQRLVSTRPDVLAYESEPLERDVTVAGPIGVQLFASTTGTDSDWVVKLIDIHPANAEQLPGYQQPVGMEIMRGRYRNSFSHPEAMRPGEVTPIRFDILDKFHTFKKGHRIGVQVQSSFFPYIDRNPQTFVNIYRAKAEDYVKATQRVCRSSQFASHLVLPVLKQTADSIYVNARVWTDAADGSFAQALAIKGDTLLAVGSNAEVRALADAKTRVVDLGGKLVTPGFIDNHTHFVDASLSLTDVDLRDAATPAEFSRRVAARAKQQPGEWVLRGNWDHELWGAALPAREWIDAQTGDTPVFVVRLDGHMGLANSAALKLAGIDARTPDPVGGEIIHDSKGQPTGLLKDTAMDAVYRIIPQPSTAHIDAALQRGFQEALSHGVTQVHDMSDGSWVALESFRRVHAAGKLGIRVYSFVPIADWARLADFVEANGRGDEWLRWGGVKGFVDGSLGSTTAWFYEPFTDAPTTRGLTMVDPELLAERIEGADRAGLHVTVHAIGDRANDWLLDQFERTIEKNGPRDRRFRNEHSQHLRPAAFARFKQVGVIASMQPYHAIDDGRWAEKRIGPERLEGTYAFRSFLDAGVTLTFGSDWAVAPLDPLTGIDGAVNRRTIDGKHPDGWQPQQRITMVEALRAYTSSNAYAGYQEKRLGKLQPGLLADFVVLSEDLFRIDPKRIGDVTVLRTVIGGKERYVSKQ